jgi:plasmid stabilization system protein ParE
MPPPDVARDLEYLEEAVEEAVEEAEAAARWYAGRSAAAAAGFLNEIDAAESAIARLPEAWPRFDHGTRRYLLRRYPLSIIYRVESRRILIVAVAHGSRRPGYWKSRVEASR